MFSSSNGVSYPYTGYGGQSCALSGCHAGFALNSSSGSFSVSLLDNGIPVTSYNPGRTYQVSVKLTFQGALRIGMASEVLNSSHIGVGTLSTAGSSNMQKFTFITNRPYITHTYAGCNSMQNTGTYVYNWTAPVKGTGTLTIYTSGNAANGNGNEGGDHIYTNSLAITEGTSSVEAQNTLSASLNVYPNPATNFLNLEYTLPSASHVTVQAWGIDGKLIKTLADAQQAAGKNNIQANISDMTTGTYLVKISAGDYSSVQRVVKN